MRAYVDTSRNVHVVDSLGKDVRVTSRSRYSDARLAPDGRTFGALVFSQVGGDSLQEAIEVREKLLIFRDRRIIRSLAPGGYIRAWDFWEGGRQVTLYAGGLHFAGWYALFDVESGKRLGTSEDPATEQSPAWVRALEP